MLPIQVQSRGLSMFLYARLPRRLPTPLSTGAKAGSAQWLTTPAFLPKNEPASSRCGHPHTRFQRQTPINQISRLPVSPLSSQPPLSGWASTTPASASWSTGHRPKASRASCKNPDEQDEMAAPPHPSSTTTRKNENESKTDSK